MDDGNDTTDARPRPRDGGAHTDARPTSGGAQCNPPRMRQSDLVSNDYNMSHPDRGTAIIFNNKRFKPKTGMGERFGTDVDANAMRDLLDNVLGFERVLQFNDLTVNEMKAELQKVAKMDHSNSDCFVCVILTHGEDEGYLYGSDDRVKIDEFVRFFKGDDKKRSSLAGKPKIFFIQACRGLTLDHGQNVADAAGEDEAMVEDTEIRRIPSEADFLMAYSVVPGYYAWRNSSQGSWFIQAVVDVIKKNCENMDLLSMMTLVNKKVAYDFESSTDREVMTGKKQIPCITSMLTKHVFFTKK